MAREESSGGDGKPAGVKTPPSSPLPKYEGNPALLPNIGATGFTLYPTLSGDMVHQHLNQLQSIILTKD